MDKEPKKQKKRPKRKNKSSKDYIDNDEFKLELLKYRDTIDEDGLGMPSERLGEFFNLIANHYANQPCWSSYSMLEDMKGDALERMMLYLPKMDPLGNPYSYCTSICFSAFMANIRKTKRNDKTKRNLAMRYLTDISSSESFCTEKQKQILDEISAAID